MGILTRLKDKAKAEGIAKYYQMFGKSSTLKEYSQEAFDAAFGSKAEEPAVTEEVKAEESEVTEEVKAEEPAVNEVKAEEPAVNVPVADNSTTPDDSRQVDSPEMPVDEVQVIGDSQAKNVDL